MRIRDTVLSLPSDHTQSNQIPVKSDRACPVKSDRASPVKSGRAPRPVKLNTHTNTKKEQKECKDLTD